MRLPRIRCRSVSYYKNEREFFVEVGWPNLHVAYVTEFFGKPDDEIRSHRDFSFHASVRGFALNWGFVTGCYPDLDEDGWPQ